VMDASTLVLTTINHDPRAGQAKSFGRWAQSRRPGSPFWVANLNPMWGVERDEFDEARRRLERAGFVLEDADRSWDHFVRLRQEYAGRGNARARYWATPPWQWIGNRSRLRYPRPHETRLPGPGRGQTESREQARV
jgi:hypothetical protein